MIDDHERPFRDNPLFAFLTNTIRWPDGTVQFIPLRPNNIVGGPIDPTLLEELKAAAITAAAVPPPPYPINYGYAPAPAAEKPAEVECPHCRQMVSADKKPCTAIVWCNELIRPKW